MLQRCRGIFPGLSAVFFYDDAIPLPPLPQSVNHSPPPPSPPSPSYPPDQNEAGHVIRVCHSVVMHVSAAYSLVEVLFYGTALQRRLAGATTLEGTLRAVCAVKTVD